MNVSMAQLTGSRVLSARAFAGYEVAVGTSAVAISIRDRDSAGAIMAVIPASATAGTRVNLACPILAPSGQGMYVDFGAATGTVNILFQ